MSWLERTIIHRDEELWLETRRTGIGASEAAAVLDVSHFKNSNAVRVWRSKCRIDEAEIDADTQRMFDRAHRIEPFILGEYAAAHPELTVSPARMEVTRHPEFPRIFATRDALVYGEDGKLSHGLDAKWLGTWQRQHFGEPGSDAMPPDYVMQGLLSCEVFDVPKWDFYVLWSDKSDAEYTVHRSTEVAGSLIVRLLDWWETYVESREMPPPDGSDETKAFITRAFPKAVRPLLPATSAAIELGRIAKAARDRIKAAEADKNAADNALRLLCGDADGIDSVCTWRNNRDSTSLDVGAYVAWLEDEFCNMVEAEWDTRKKAEADLAEARRERTTIKPGPRVLRITYKED